MHDIDEIEMELEALEQDRDLVAAENFQRRTEALEAIELDVLERIEALLRAGGETEELEALQRRARVLSSRLEETNERLFERLRGLIRSGSGRGEELGRWLRLYAGYAPDIGIPSGSDYDSLDALVCGLLLAEPAPEATQARKPEMVYYQPTPARIMLDLAAQARFSANDVFYDIGSGLGQVVILVHLLSGVRACGIEYEPAYCAYAQRCASGLSLSQVQFINVDARAADLAGGTVFFMYTPFTGQMLQEVLRRLKEVGRTRPIRLFTYGPCTVDVVREDWLTVEDGSSLDPERLAVFHSRVP